jgi:hypothetical protein
MNCYECAKNGKAVAAVGTCHHCGAGLCLEHAREAPEYTIAGTHYACQHDFREPQSAHGMAAGVTRANWRLRLPARAR